MTHPLEPGDWVAWNSEAGRVQGRIVAVHTRDFVVNGYTRHASPQTPQYQILNPRTGHVAYHLARALAPIRAPDA